MKTVLIFILLIATSHAAEAVLELPKLSVETQLQIRTAQLTAVRYSDTLGKLSLQYQDLQEKYAAAKKALEDKIKAIPKPKECPTCELSDVDLTWVKPK